MSVHQEKGWQKKGGGGAAGARGANRFGALNLLFHQSILIRIHLVSFQPVSADAVVAGTYCLLLHGRGGLFLSLGGRCGL